MPPGKLFKILLRNRGAGKPVIEQIEMLRERQARMGGDVITEAYAFEHMAHPNSQVTTITLIEWALKQVGGSDLASQVGYMSEVCRAAGLRDIVGDWPNDPRGTSRAFERIRQALLESSDKDEILSSVELSTALDEAG